MKTFLKRNKDFWSNYPPASNSNQKVLIEEPSLSFITHGNAIDAIILNQAKGFIPVWLHNDALDIELLKSYLPSAEQVTLPKLSYLNKLQMCLVAIWKFLIMLTKKDILSFSYDGVKYGDIAYDNYLTWKKVATIRKIDLHMLRVIYSCIRRHESIREVLSGGNFGAVLVSHKVGINSGVMLRTALRYGYKGYLRGGHNQSTLQCFETIDEVYDYSYKPSVKDIDTINATLGPEFDTFYKVISKKQFSGISSADGKFAFSTSNKIYTDRESFCRAFGLNFGKKNVFVMLHAFTDYPHSHFSWMIFKDYYDWFVQTLSFARTFEKVNWIFKQHPSIQFYPVNDVSFDRLFHDVPANVVYISEENQIDTRSLTSCADIIITCLGSAGFELPAMAGIPSIVAGDTLYSGLGFTLEPRTKKQYFEILSSIHEISHLTPAQQRIAQAAYMHIYEFSRVKMSVCPLLSHQKQRDSDINNWYWGKVEELYDSHGEVIKNEIRKYIDEVAKPEFKRLNSLQNYCELIGEDTSEVV